MNEELEKIAQDLRRKERELWAGNPPRMGNGAVALMLDGYASRLEVALGLAPRPKCEAAAEREKVEAVTIAATKAVNLTDEKLRRDAGNAAALREAIGKISLIATTNINECVGDESDMHIVNLARAALAAPARNCDRYRTEKEAEAAFDRFCAKERNGQCKPWECPLKSTGGKYCYVAWLLATAEEGEAQHDQAKA